MKEFFTKLLWIAVGLSLIGTGWVLTNYFFGDDPKVETVSVDDDELLKRRNKNSKKHKRLIINKSGGDIEIIANRVILKDLQGTYKFVFPDDLEKLQKKE